MRAVSEKGYIMVEGREYSVPMKYRSKDIEFYKTDSKIFIFDSRSGVEVASHTIPPIGGGKRVVNRDHFRNKLFSLKELEDKVLGFFDNEQWKEFVKGTPKAYPRYSRDQYTFALENMRIVEDEGIFLMAVEYCLENKTYGMKKLHDTYGYLLKEHKQEQEINFKAFSGMPALLNGTRATELKVAKRPVESYESLVVSENGGTIL